MNRVGVGGEVVDGPFLCGTQCRVLRHVHHDIGTVAKRDAHGLVRRIAVVGPLERIAGRGSAAAVHRTQQGLGGPEELRAGRTYAVYRRTGILDGALGQVLGDAHQLGLGLVQGNVAGQVRNTQGRLGVQHQVARVSGRANAAGISRTVTQQVMLDPEAHDLAARARISRIEVDSRYTATERFVRTKVDQIDRGAIRQFAEVDDDIGALGQRHEQLCLAVTAAVQVQGIHVDRGRKESLFGADLPDLHIRIIELQPQEARAAAVQQAQAVQGGCDFQLRPGNPVHHHHVEERLRVPDRQHIRRHALLVADERNFQVSRFKPLEECPVTGIEQLSVPVEGAVLDRDGYLADRVPDRITGYVECEHTLACGRSGPGQCPVPFAGSVRTLRGIAHFTVPAAQQPETGRAGIDVVAGHAQGMVVVPQGGCRLVIRIGEIGIAHCAVVGTADVIEQPAARGVPRRQVVGRRQPPGLRVAVAFRSDMRTVYMGDDGHGTLVAVLVGSRAIGPGRPLPALLRRVRPVHRLVDRQQMIEVVAVLIHQVVDPAHVDRGIRCSLDGVGRVVELGIGRRRDTACGCGIGRGAIAPYRGGGEPVVTPVDGIPNAPWQDLLLELPYRDVVVVETRAIVVHHRRDHQWCHVLRDTGWIQCATRHRVGR